MPSNKTLNSSIELEANMSDEKSESENEVVQEDYDKMKAILDQESEFQSVKWESDKDRIKPPFMVRMINDDDFDPLYNYNSHLKLQELNSMNQLPCNEIKLTGKSRVKKSIFNHVYLFLSTFGCLVIIIVELVYIIIAMNHFRICGFVDIYLITSGIFHIIMVIIEWFRVWIWNVKHHKDSRGCVHIFQLTTAILLFISYIFCLLWYTIGFAWIMVPYSENLNKTNEEETFEVHYESTVTIVAQTHCSPSFYYGAIIYQAYVLCLFIFRLVLLGFGQACRSLFNKIADSYAMENSIAVPFVARNELSDRLPPISSFRLLGSHKHSFYPTTIHGRSTCMIQTHPEWRYT